MPKYKETPKVDLTSREFTTIKDDLIDHARRFYPQTYKDFSRGSVGSFFLDAVAYVGDMLSFYVDYSANEAFLDTAGEAQNIISHAKEMGFNSSLRNTTFGDVHIYVTVQADPVGIGPDTRYLPIIRRGTTINASNGGSFTLTNDLDFSHESAEVVVASQDPSTGAPLSFAVRMKGEVVSGIFRRHVAEIGTFSKFRKIQIPDSGIAEIVRIIDSEGNDYFEVETLSQDLVMQEVSSGQADPPVMIKPVAVERKYTVSYSAGRVTVQFGSGSPTELNLRPIPDPATVLLDKHAKSYTTETSFDPTKITTSDTLGVGPANTTLTIIYRIVDASTANVAVGALDSVSSPVVEFRDTNSLSTSLKNSVISSIQSFNEEAIVGSNNTITLDEIKTRTKTVYASQNRAVTKSDYEAFMYNMPGKFGSIKRVNVVRDSTSRKNKINAYIISQNSDGQLQLANRKIKENLKTWISKYKMITDSIDIFDARLVNVGINYAISIEPSANKFSVLRTCNQQLALAYSEPLLISEPLYLTDVYKILNSIPGVADVTNVEFVVKQGTNYSSSFVSLSSITSKDGKTIITPEDTIFEIKFLDQDIKGVIQ